MKKRGQSPHSALADAYVPESWVLDTVDDFHTLECSVDVASELLRLQHCAYSVVGTLTDKDFHLAVFVVDSCEGVVVTTSERTHREDILCFRYERNCWGCASNICCFSCV